MVIDEDGVARCPYIEDGYIGKPILFKYCPECGKFLNGPEVSTHHTSQGATYECDIQRDKRGA